MFGPEVYGSRGYAFTVAAVAFTVAFTVTFSVAIAVAVTPPLFLIRIE
jgi:hypothetical protein